MILGGCKFLYAPIFSKKYGYFLLIIANFYLKCKKEEIK